MRAAVISSGVVVNYAEVGAFTATYVAPGSSVIGSTWDGNSFTPPVVAFVLAAAQTAKRLQVNNERDRQQALLDSAHSGHTHTLLTQLAIEATAYTADNSAITPMLSARATAQSTNRAALAPAITTDATSYFAAAGVINGNYNAKYTAIAAAANLSDMTAINPLTGWTA